MILTTKEMNQMNWDVYFLKIAKEVSKKSKCLSRQIGAVLVKDKNIVSTGYNGPARGVKHCNERDVEFYEKLDGKLLNSLFLHKDKEEICPRRYMEYGSGQGLHLCQAGHAERNAIVQAAKHGISTKGASLYCYCGEVCKDCAIEIINAGITELVFLSSQKVYDKYSAIILEESGINIRRLDQFMIE